MTNIEFIEYVKAQCKIYGVNLVIGKGKQLNYPDAGIRISGYFCSNPPELAYAKFSHDAISIILHEYCHMLQWIDNFPLYIESLKKEDDGKLDEWLLGKEFKYKSISTSIRRIQKIELDCEKRAIKLSKKLKLNIDIPKYIKDANSYVFLYTMILEKRKWPKNIPAGVSKIHKIMPDKFIRNYTTLPPEYKVLYEKYCY